jgi:NTE family protein
VRDIVHFDRLPTAFRAVATDMETGEAVVLAEGDLALAMRSSMSVPAVFPPTEWEGRLLGDGGLVDNLPIDVARQMGAERLIVVNIGTPLAGRGTLGSALGLTAQMINILTEQNVQRSLHTLGADDLLITPELGALTSADFNQAAAFIRLGEAQAQAMVSALRSWAMTEADYTRWREARRAGEPRPPVLQFVAFEGSTDTEPARLAPQLGSRRGAPFDAIKAERDLVRLAASGDYVRADYRLLRTDAGEGLVFELEDKPWGPNYFNIGLSLSTDLAGASAFNILVSHNRHWLTSSGTEWRNQLQIGEVPLLASEIYHPLNWTVGLSNDWFSAARVRGERRTRAVFASDGGPKLGDLHRSTALAGIDLGQAWGTFGELRLGTYFMAARDEPLQQSANIPGLSSSNTWQEAGVRARLVLDQLDFANFPQQGYRVETELTTGEHEDVSAAHFWRVEAEATQVMSWSRQTLNLHVAARWSTAATSSSVGRYSLGGFQQLSGYQVGQVSGNALVFARLGVYRRFSESPVFARGLFFGGSLEVGNAWSNPQDLRLRGLRQGGSLYLGADTGIGPMYAGVTWAPRGQPGLIVFLGRP